MSAKHLGDLAAPVPLPIDESATGAQPIPDGPLTVTRSILPGGVRLLTEALPGTRTATVGFFVAAGSRDETEEQSGASHFLEHLLFKGTYQRSALEIAMAFDAVGADSNAATSKETTHYWAKVLDADLRMAVETLTDMVTSSTLTKRDVETERTVIIDELAMSEDSPPAVAHEAFARAVFGDTALGRPVGGTIASVSDMPADVIRDLYHQRYSSPALIICAAGNIGHSQVRDLVEEALAETTWDQRSGALPERRRPTRSAGQEGWDEHQHDLVLERGNEQAHVLVGGPWLKATDKRKFISSVLLTILGGGVSSRLFQEIREKRGLAYTTYAFESSYADAGMFGMYGGCAPQHQAEVEKIMWGEVEKLASGQLSTDELERAKGQLRGNMALGLEDTGARMSRLARSELLGRFIAIDGALARIQAVEVGDVADLAALMVTQPRARALVTPRE